jgi:MinD-like ATPase involved in chromosome partitioning or flagellar assembly
MNTPTTLTSTLITLQHPGGSIRVAVPADLSLRELMPDFLEVTGQPDRDDWTLSPPDGDPYPSEHTLSDLGVQHGTVLVLNNPGAAVAADSGPAHGAHPPPDRAQTRDALGPVSARTAGVLPTRLSRLSRCRVAVRALADTTTRIEPRSPRAASTRGPAAFTRPARLSPIARIGGAWAHTDYGHRLEQLIIGPRLARCATIAVISPKGGVGKTTTTALLGSLLAFLRRDRVVAVETNPDWGSLGRRLVPNHPVFIDDLLAGPLADGQLSPTRLDAQLGRGPDGLMVCPAPTDPDRARQLDQDAYRTLFDRLAALVGTLVLDCGTGLDDPPARAALACADQLVLVCDDEPDTASIVTEAAHWLQRAQPPLVLVVNNLRRRSRIDITALERETSHARGLAVIPRDERAAGLLHDSRFSWTHAPAGWETAVRELAALLAAGWPALQIADRPGCR